MAEQAENEKIHTTKGAAKIYQRLAFGLPHAEMQPADIRDIFKGLLVSTEQIRGYRQAARLWLIAIFTVIIAIIVALIWAFQSSTVPVYDESYYYSDAASATPMLLAIKALIIFIIGFIILRFVTQSYKINKHLEVTYSHRWALQHSITEHLELAGPDADKPALLKELLPFFYDDIDTGYLSKKGGDKQAAEGINALAKVINRTQQ